MRAYLLRLLAVSLFVSVCEFFLPGGRVRRFAAPILGLAVTASVLLPALSLFGSGGEAAAFLLPEVESVVSEDAYQNSVEAEYIRRIEASIEKEGNVDAQVTLGKDFSIAHITLSGDVTTRVMAYITMKLEVPRSYVEIR